MLRVGDWFPELLIVIPRKANSSFVGMAEILTVGEIVVFLKFVFAPVLASVKTEVSSESQVCRV